MKQLKLLLLLLIFQYQASGQFVKSYLIDEKGYDADSTIAKCTRTIFWNRFRQLGFEDHSLSDGKMYHSGGIVADTLVPSSVSADNIQFYRNGVCTHFHVNEKRNFKGITKKDVR